MKNLSGKYKLKNIWKRLKMMKFAPFILINFDFFVKDNRKKNFDIFSLKMKKNAFLKVYNDDI